MKSFIIYSATEKPKEVIDSLHVVQPSNPAQAEVEMVKCIFVLFFLLIFLDLIDEFNGS